MSLTRVGATRQAIRKGVAVLGAEPDRLTAVRLPELPGGPVRLVPHARTPGLFTLETPLAWMGTPAARDEVFDALGRAVRILAQEAHRGRARLLPTSVALDGLPTVLGGDVHELEMVDAAEQEVCCNALRRHAPMLIAYAGRGVVGPGRPRDRVGSRWLADSAEHLATRYLSSTAPEHLERVRADLRRGGVTRLEQMDVAPLVRPDGTRTVLVRCLDAQATLASTRAHAVLLAALAVHARRLVRDGRREGNLPQRTLEEDRARAIAGGPRALLTVDDRSRGRPSRDRRQNGGRDQRREEPARRRVATAMRHLHTELRRDFTGLDVSAAELSPLLAALDLPGLGVPYHRPDDLLQRWAEESPHDFGTRLLYGLADGRPGGAVLDDLRATHPGKVELLLGSWTDELNRPPAPRGPRRDNDRKGGGGQRGSHRNSGKKGRR